MEELAKLEAQRGNPEYLETEAGEAGFGQKERGGAGAGKWDPGNKDGRRYAAGHGGHGGRKSSGQANGLMESSGKSRRASNEMCNFLIFNISSLQLIPVNMIAYRSQYGSANPTAIIAPAIAATLVSTLTAVVYCKMKDRVSADRIGGYGDDKSCMDKRKMKRPGDFDLTAGEVRRGSERGADFCRATSNALSEKRNGRGGKAV